jgi:hypothetical protein
MSTTGAALSGSAIFARLIVVPPREAGQHGDVRALDCGSGATAFANGAAADGRNRSSEKGHSCAADSKADVNVVGPRGLLVLGLSHPAKLLRLLQA